MKHLRIFHRNISVLLLTATALYALTGCAGAQTDAAPASGPSAPEVESEALPKSAVAPNACEVVRNAVMGDATGVVPASNHVADADFAALSALVPGLERPDCVWEYSFDNGTAMKGFGVNYFGKPESYIAEIGQLLSEAGATGGPAVWTTAGGTNLRVSYMSTKYTYASALEAAGGPYIQLLTMSW